MIKAIIAILATAACLIMRHQRRLKRNAYLILEALRNRDFMFRLSTRRLLFGERAMQEALNSMGDIIRGHVRQSEIKSWESMTRVLTHEIMNSVAPIMSISQSIKDLGQASDPMIKEGISAICDTAQRLSAFVDSFRKMSMLQKPEPSLFAASEIAAQLRSLYPDIFQYSDYDSPIVLLTDKNMLAQVLINLCKNAIEAHASKVCMQCEPDKSKNMARLIVSNNGDPIPAEVRDDIFTPFFTTKDRGSGIGLSICREIIVKQGGRIELLDRPVPGFRTSFLIEVESEALNS